MILSSAFLTLFVLEKMAFDLSIYSGVWNETEAWPLMFKSANILGTLPSVDEVQVPCQSFRNLKIDFYIAPILAPG